MTVYTHHQTLDTNLVQNINHFLGTCTGFTYFQSPFFFQACDESPQYKPHYMLAWQSEKIVGVLLYFKQITLPVPLLGELSSRNIIWGGPFVTDNNYEIVQGLLAFYQKHKMFSIYTQVRNLFDTASYADIFTKLGFAHESQLDILFDLTKSETQLWSEVQTNRRNTIKRSIKNGCVFEENTTVEALRKSYHILTTVYRRIRLPLPNFSHFEALYRNSDTHNGLRIFTVSYQSAIIGCMVCLVSNGIIFDYYAGSYEEHYQKYPNNLIPWEIMRWGQHNGYKVFDFGGAGKPHIPYGVREYKQKFGGQTVNFGRYEATSFPLFFKLISVFFKLGQRLKLSPTL